MVVLPLDSIWVIILKKHLQSDPSFATVQLYNLKKVTTW